ncbi:hypothetical protein FPZ49_14390 [Paenibacillus cremeus]|uniref:Uncharacterized protein n=1 Tax=Paenibacillus cremeus TaxID=2163881 RepID=A0A559KB87_9BACL|nr:hypothetical protein FPZ49_14390 [Paenibacillus cremeus]
MSKDTQIVETVTGNWLRFPNSFRKFHCLVELSDQLSLNINVKSGSVHVHKKDNDQVYQQIGELCITSSGRDVQCSVLSTAASAKESDTKTPPKQQSDAS